MNDTAIHPAPGVLSIVDVSVETQKRIADAFTVMEQVNRVDMFRGIDLWDAAIAALIGEHPQLGEPFITTFAEHRMLTWQQDTTTRLYLWMNGIG